MLFYTFWLNATTPPSSLTVLCSRVLNVLPYAVSEIHCAAVADLSLSINQVELQS